MNPDSSSAASVYRNSQFENAPPLALVRMLYGGALRFLEQASSALADGQHARFQERCLRVLAIVAELRTALDPAQAPELVDELESLYLFVEERLRAAIDEQSPAHVQAARGVLETLLEGWNAIEVRA